jgi:phenylacetate-coenzyme A ligase PaaK-like adenylate-forming protein
LDIAYETVSEYQNRFSQLGILPSSFTKLRDLQNFPLTTRSDLADNSRRFLSYTAPTEFIRSTSGSTGRRLILYGCRAENELHQALFEIVNPRFNSSVIVLRLSPPVRRLHAPALFPEQIVNLNLAYIPEQLPGMWLTHTDFVHQVLSEEYFIAREPSRVTVLHITPPYLLESLTSNLKAVNINPADYGIETIVFSGGHVTQRQRLLCKEIWHAHCATNFSCTEVLSSFLEVGSDIDTYVPSLGAYAEVIDPKTGRWAEPGCTGALALTSAYPFQQVMPLIRYQPGDWVQAIDLSNGQRGFRVLGRQHQCIFLPGGLVVGPIQVIEAVTPFDEIPQIPAPRFILKDESVKEHPIIKLDIEINSSSKIRNQKLEDEIALSLLSKLDSSILPDVHVQLHPKGALSNFFRIYPEN